MIHVILRGRLGNWLFQYAIGRQLALRHNTGLVLNLSNRRSIQDWTGTKIVEELSHFSIAAHFSRLPHQLIKAYHQLRVHKLLGGGIYFREKQWGFDPDVLLLPDHVYLFGYFQSAKYFHDIAPLLRAELRFKAHPTDAATLDVAAKIAATNSVAIAVRRGDYLQSPLHNICHLPYYQNAVAFMRTRLDSPYFFVFSDDIQWCKAHIKIADCDFVDLPLAQKHPIVDFWLLSQCKHQVIANSTFPWWAAWLNDNPDKIVVAPNKWFTDEAMNERALQDTIPGDWIRIDVATKKLLA